MRLSTDYKTFSKTTAIIRSTDYKTFNRLRDLQPNISKTVHVSHIHEDPEAHDYHIHEDPEAYDYHIHEHSGAYNSIYQY